jgi:serine protease AprX
MPMAAALPEVCPGGRRYKIRFPDDASFEAAAGQECDDFSSPVASAKRRFRTLALPAIEEGEPAAERRLDRRVEFLEREYRAEVEEDPQYDLDFPPGWHGPPPAEKGPSLDDVLEAIRARDAWRNGNRGGGATIAIVDTGVDGDRREMPFWKRRGSWQVQGAMPFCDPVGHGTLCAVVAAGTRAAGGRFEGVAPDAGIIACRTRFFDSELTAIYDHLIALVEADKSLRLITTNSFGRRCGLPPPPVEGDFPAALEEAIAAGIAVFFSAGNNHDLAGGRPADCHPSTIWHYKGRADVFTVGTCDLEGRLWEYSSRGPGQEGNAAKPDIVAPTPRDGLVAFGGEARSFPEGWGTSGACPQAAGLAALLWTAEPSLTVGELLGRIRAGARDLGLAWTCQGAGQLDCFASLAIGDKMEEKE